MVAETLHLNIESIRDPKERLKLIEIGFTKEQVLSFKDLVHLNIRKFAQLLGTSVRTIQRVTEGSPSKPILSESIIDLVDIYEVGLELFNTVDDVTEFMESENPYLDQKKPIELCKTSSGRHLVYTMLNQIKYGIMS